MWSWFSFLVWYKKYIIVRHVNSQFSQEHLLNEKTIYSPLYVLGTVLRLVICRCLGLPLGCRLCFIDLRVFVSLSCPFDLFNFIFRLLGVMVSSLLFPRITFAVWGFFFCSIQLQKFLKWKWKWSRNLVLKWYLWEKGALLNNRHQLGQHQSIGSLLAKLILLTSNFVLRYLFKHG